MSDEEDIIDPVDEGGDDLFGDDDVQSDAGRVLSDAELASDPDAGDQDDRQDDHMDEQEVKDLVVMDMPIYRHRVPKMSNGSLASLKMPNFVRVAAEEYHPDTFEPTEWDKNNAKDDNPKSVIRYQRHPETGKLKSNASIYRWSDGSMTVAIGNDHFDISKKHMAPPADKPYEERLDAHYYAAAAHMASSLLVTVGHVTEQYTVLPNKDLQDDALALFSSRMAEAARSKRKEGDSIFTATKDPELQRKEAELAEKERVRTQRRRENAAARNEARVGGFRSGGLSVGDLEGGRRPGASGGSRKRGQPGGSKAKKRRPEYDSDDDLPAGRGRNDEYDRDDGFIAPSDDEDEEVEEDEEDLLDDDESEEEKPRSKRQRTVEAEQDADADADGDLDDEAAAPAADSARSRRRNIVDDDEDE